MVITMNKFDEDFINKFQPQQCKCGWIFKPTDIKGKYYKCPVCETYYKKEK